MPRSVAIAPLEALDATLPLLIHIGQEIELNIGRIGEMADYYVNRLSYDPEVGDCRAYNDAPVAQNLVWVVIIHFCEVMN